jgi:hypothetical protein
MHRTASVDYGVVLDGEVWLDVDDGVQTRSTRGATVVGSPARRGRVLAMMTCSLADIGVPPRAAITE